MRAAGLLLAAVVAVATGCGGSDEPNDRPDRPATTTGAQQEPETTTGSTEPPEPEPKPKRTLDLEQFRSPTGNIGCVITERSARCDISERDWSPPAKPADCQLDYGQGIQVSDSGRAQLVCAGDTTLNPQGPVLKYGKESRVGDISCRSEKNFMSCRNVDSKHGFVLNRERYRLF